MAKKPAQPAGEASEKPTASAGGEAKESKKPREHKGKESKDAKDTAAAKEPRERKAKTAPAPPSAESPPRTVPPAAQAAPSAPGEPSKKKGRRPGFGPSRGKKLRAVLAAQREKLTKAGGAVPLLTAIGFLKQFKRSKFDETVEIHMALGVDTAQSDQLVRGTVALPHGIGKSVRVVVFCQGDNIAKAKEAGADYAGSDDLVKKIQQENWLDFDVALATQDMMGMASRLGKILGPRGLMPTPKSGTVITPGADVAAAVREFKAGKVEYRTDKGGNIHAGVGKLSFEENKLATNITAFVDQVKAVKPSGVKGNYVKSITLSATMSPGILITV
jgi:large subunit ribosomal protein L1